MVAERALFSNSPEKQGEINWRSSVVLFLFFCILLTYLRSSKDILENISGVLFLQNFGAQIKTGWKIIGSHKLPLTHERFHCFPPPRSLAGVLPPTMSGKDSLPSSLSHPPPKEGGTEMEISWPAPNNCLLCEEHSMFQALVRGVGCGKGGTFKSNRKHNPCLGASG